MLQNNLIKSNNTHINENTKPIEDTKCIQDTIKTSKKQKVKLLDPKIDAIFQILFSKTNPEITKALLSAILDTEIKEITNKTLQLDLNKILDRTYPTDKIGVLDVRAQINNEIEIDLEMKMLNTDKLLDRILWYWAKLYSSQLKSGDEYKNLKKTLEILIINEPIPFLKNIPKPCTKWHIREDELCSYVLTDKLEVIIIELSKVKQEYAKHKDNPLLQWMMFLLNPESEEVSEIMEKNNDINTVVYELEQMSEDEINMQLAELREKAIRDEHAILDTGLRMGREEGYKSGMSAGRQLEKIELIKKSIELNMPLEQISLITGYSIEQIQNIANE